MCFATYPLQILIASQTYLDVINRPCLDIFHFQLVIWMRDVPLEYVVRQHVKVVHVLPWDSTCLNLDKKIIARAPILGAKSSLKKTQGCLDTSYLNWLYDTFTISNAFVYHIFSMIFIDTDAYLYVKQRKLCRVVELCSLTSIRNFLALVMWPCRPQKQKDSCRTLTMMVRKKDGIVTSMLHSTRNST